MIHRPIVLAADANIQGIDRKRGWAGMVIDWEAEKLINTGVARRALGSQRTQLLRKYEANRARTNIRG